MNKLHHCPVCSYDRLNEAPFNKTGEPSYEICPCCGFEFGVDGGNDERVFDEYRKAWVKAGTPWFIQKLKPISWSYEKQRKEPRHG